MKKAGINYLLLNCALLFFIIFMLYRLNVLNMIVEVILLILLSLILSYIIYPLHKIISKKTNAIISLTIIYMMIIIFLFILIYSIIPNAHIIDKIIELFNNLLKFENVVNSKLNVNINLDLYFNKFLNLIVSNSIFWLKNLIRYLKKFIFISILSICILLNINYIKKIISKFKYKDLLFNINDKLIDYLHTNLKIVCIQFIEYTLIFLLIGHPNYILLGILNSLNNFIPFLGQIITNTIAIITSSMLSKKLLILTSTISVVMPLIDAYFIIPTIYRKTNKIPQTLYIASIIIFGTIFGIYGIILSLPIIIIIIEILKYKNIVKQDL